MFLSIQVELESMLEVPMWLKMFIAV